MSHDEDAPMSSGPSLTLKALFEASSAPAIKPGSVIGRFQVLRSVGSGGMGDVYLAYDQTLQRRVALKLLRFATRDHQLREAQSLAKLNHPNIVAVYDVGIYEGHLWLAMEYVDGVTLSKWVAVSRRGWPETLRCVTLAGRGLAAAHAAGLVHRDFKPGNVMIDMDGRVRVLDFGLATPASAEGLGEIDGSPSDTDEPPGSPPPHTRGGAIVGTPAYMAPEQWHGHEADARADQFALCVTLWEVLYGERPFVGDSKALLSDNICAGRIVTPPSGAGVPKWLHQALLRGLSVDANGRFPSLNDLLDVFENGRLRARFRLALSVLGGLGLAAVTALGTHRHAQARQIEACVTAGSSIRDLWDDAGRSRLRDSLLATEVSYASQTSSRMIASIDRWSESWSKARSWGCLQAELKHQLPPRAYARSLVCLDERRQELRSLLEVYGQAEAADVRHAVSATMRMKDPLACIGDAGHGPTSSAEEPPLMPLANARTALLRSRALESAGRYPEALAAARAARAGIGGATDRPRLLAESLLAEGRIQLETGDHALAEWTLSGVFFMAAGAREWSVAAEAATVLIDTVGNINKLGRQRDGLVWNRHAEVAIRQLDDEDDALNASRLNYLGNVQYSAGDYAEARSTHEAALAIRERTLGPEHPDVATSLNNLGHALAAISERPRARAMQERALAIRRKTLGDRHPRVAESLASLGTLLREEERYEESALATERALAIAEETLGPNHPTLGVYLNNLAVVYDTQGAHAAALAAYQRALRIKEATLGPDHLSVSKTLRNMGITYKLIGDHDHALGSYARALRIIEAKLGPVHPEAATTLMSMGSLHRGMGNFEEAEAFLDRALAIRERVYGVAHAEVATCLVNLAGLHISMRSWSRARALLERALAIRESTARPVLSDVAIVLYNLAYVHLASGRMRESLAAYERSLALRRQVFGPEHPSVASGLAGLAGARLVLGDAEEALKILEEALSIFAAHDGEQDGESAAHFDHAQAILATGGDRGRALAEAVIARDAYRARDRGKLQDLADVESWIRRHYPAERRR